MEFGVGVPGREMRRFPGVRGPKRKLKIESAGKSDYLVDCRSSPPSPLLTVEKAVGYHHRVLDCTPPTKRIKSFMCPREGLDTFGASLCNNLREITSVHILLIWK